MKRKIFSGEQQSDSSKDQTFQSFGGRSKMDSISPNQCQSFDVVVDKHRVNGFKVLAKDTDDEAFDINDADKRITAYYPDGGYGFVNINGNQRPFVRKCGVKESSQDFVIQQIANNDAVEGYSALNGKPIANHNGVKEEVKEELEEEEEAEKEGKTISWKPS